DLAPGYRRVYRCQGRPCAGCRGPTGRPCDPPDYEGGGFLYGATQPVSGARPRDPRPTWRPHFRCPAPRHRHRTRAAGRVLVTPDRPNTPNLIGGLACLRGILRMAAAVNSAPPPTTA